MELLDNIYIPQCMNCINPFCTDDHYLDDIEDYTHKVLESLEFAGKSCLPVDGDSVIDCVSDCYINAPDNLSTHV